MIFKKASRLFAMSHHSTTPTTSSPPSFKAALSTSQSVPLGRLCPSSRRTIPLSQIRQRERVYELLSMLADESHIFLLPSHPRENIRESWVVTNVRKLLQDLVSMLMLKKEQCYPTGIMPLGALDGIFPTFNPQMVAGFLESLQFCYEIEPPNTDSYTPFEAYYFFPALAQQPVEGLVFSGTDGFHLLH